MSPSWVEGGCSGMPPAQREAARHPAHRQEQYRSPALSSSPAPGLEPLKQPWKWHRTGHSRSRLLLGCRHNSGFIPWEKEDFSTAQGNPDQLPPVTSLGWMDQEETEEEL